MPAAASASRRGSLTPAELRDARRRLGLTQGQLAQALKLEPPGDRTVRRWEKGERAIPGPVVVAVEMMLERMEKPR